MLVKQVHIEQSQLVAAEADRALELIGRAIRMAGYRNIRLHQSHNLKKAQNLKSETLEIRQGIGFNRSDALYIKHEISDGVDFDCIGNVLNLERTKNGLAQQGFFLERQAGLPKGSKLGSGSLMCQSLDRHGRLQNTTLMSGVHFIWVEEVSPSSSMVKASLNSQKLFKVTIAMSLGNSTAEYSRIFMSRNLH